MGAEDTLKWGYGALTGAYITLAVWGGRGQEERGWVVRRQACIWGVCVALYIVTLSILRERHRSQNCDNDGSTTSH